MKTDKKEARILKDLAAIARVKEIMFDPKRNAEMKQFVADNACNTSINIHIRNSTVNIGGK